MAGDGFYLLRYASRRRATTALLAVAAGWTLHFRAATMAAAALRDGGGVDNRIIKCMSTRGDLDTPPASWTCSIAEGRERQCRVWSLNRSFVVRWKVIDGKDNLDVTAMGDDRRRHRCYRAMGVTWRRTRDAPLCAPACTRLTTPSASLPDLSFMLLDRLLHSRSCFFCVISAFRLFSAAPPPAYVFFCHSFYNISSRAIFNMTYRCQRSLLSRLPRRVACTITVPRLCLRRLPLRFRNIALFCLFAAIAAHARRGHRVSALLPRGEKVGEAWRTIALDAPYLPHLYAPRTVWRLRINHRETASPSWTLCVYRRISRT